MNGFESRNWLKVYAIGILSGSIWAGCASAPSVEPSGLSQSADIGFSAPESSASQKAVEPQKVVQEVSQAAEEQIVSPAAVPKAEVPVPSREACFRDAGELLTQTFIPSSVLMHATSDQTQIVLNTLNDDVLMLKNIENGTFKTLTLATHAQVSCFEALDDGFRIGVIQRDVKQADYQLEILHYDKNDNHVPAEDWSAGTRGFVPEPGTRCALLDRRDVVMSGTRPRDDRAPYHGMFRMGSRALTLFDSTSEHVPEIQDVLKRSDGTAQILVRQVRSNADNKKEWPHIVYALKNDGTMQVVMEADFIVRHRDTWIGIRKTGCIIQENAEDLCPAESVELSDVHLISKRDDAAYYFYRAKTQAWVVRVVKGGKPELAPVPKTWIFYPALPQNADAWLLTVEDDIKPDRAETLKIVKPDMNCLWGQNTPVQP